MVSVKIDVRKKDLVWLVSLVAVLIVGVVYAYGTSNPVVMGHSSGEIEVDDIFCNKITGHDCGVNNVIGSASETITFTSSFSSTSTSFTTTSESDITLTMNGGKALVVFDCSCSGNTVNAEREIALLVNGQYIDGQDATHGLKRTSHAGTEQDCGFVHLTKQTYSDENVFTWAYRSDGSTATINPDGHVCTFSVQEV